MNQYFSVGYVLKTTFSVWLKNLVAFLLISFVVCIPMLIWVGFFLTKESFNSQDIDAYQTVTSLVTWVLTPVATGAITYGVIQQLRGQSAGIGECLSRGLARLGPVLLVGLAAGFLIGLGTLACVVPGIVLMCMFYVAVPAAVMEPGIGVGGAMSRSRDLTEGLKSQVFGVVFVLGALNFGLAMVLVAVFLGGPGIDSTSSLKSFFMATTLLNVVTISIAAVAAAVTYHAIRTDREGIDIDELAAIFG